MISRNIGIIGLGANSTNYFSAVSTLGETFNIVAGADIDPSKKDFLKQRVPHAKFYRQAMASFEWSDVEAVAITVPLSGHYELARQALESGKHVLLEKPATQTLAELDALIKLAKEKGLLLVFALHSQFGSEVEWWKNEYEKEEYDRFGPITGFFVGLYDPVIENGTVIPRAMSHCGPWKDSGINALASIGQFIPPKELHFDNIALGMISTISIHETHGLGSYVFPVGKKISGRGMIHCDWTLGVNNKYTRLFYGEEEVLLNHSEETVSLINPYGRLLLRDCRTEYSRMTNHYIGVLKHFAECLETRKTNAREARMLYELYFAAFERIVPKTCG